MSARRRTSSSIFTANGRAARIVAWERRIRAAATIFMALVICSVAFTDLILRRMSINEAMLYPGFASPTSRM